MTSPTILLLLAGLAGNAAPEAAPLSLSPSAGLGLAATPLLADPSFAYAQEADAPKWSGSVNVGLSSVTGNTETSSYNVSFDAKKETPDHRITVGAFLNYSEQKDDTGEDVKTEDKQGLRGQYDWFLNEDSYLLATASAEMDDLAGVDLRLQVGGGYGRKLIKQEKLKLDGEVGLSWFKEELTSGDNDYIAARLAAKTEWAFKSGYKLTNTTELFPSVEDTDDIYGKTDTRISVQLNEDLLAQLQWVLDYDNTPNTGADRIDNRIMITLGWLFGA